MKLPIPDELRNDLERAQTSMDAMNIKLDAVIVLLGEVRDLLKEANV